MLQPYRDSFPLLRYFIFAPSPNCQLPSFVKEISAFRQYPRASNVRLGGIMH